MTSRWSAVALLATVFLAGIAATLATLRVVASREGAAWEPEPRVSWRGEPPRRVGRPPGARDVPPLMELARTRVVEHMARSLDLTDEQRAQIEEAMERQRVAAQETMNRFLPDLRTHMQSLNAEIEGILTPEQREAFREFQREDRERFRRRGHWMERQRPRSD